MAGHWAFTCAPIDGGLCGPLLEALTLKRYAAFFFDARNLAQRFFCAAAIFARAAADMVRPEGLPLRDAPVPIP